MREEARKRVRILKVDHKEARLVGQHYVTIRCEHSRTWTEAHAAHGLPDAKDSRAFRVLGGHRDGFLHMTASSVEAAARAPPSQGTIAPLPFSLRASGSSVEALPVLRSLYAAALWLGEAHTPIASFLHALQRTSGPPDTIYPLVRTADEISQRHRHIRGSRDPPDDDERAAFTFAMEHGPVARVRDDAHALNAFFSAVQCREYVHTNRTELQLVLAFWIESKEPPRRASPPAPPARRMPVQPAFWGAPPDPAVPKNTAPGYGLLGALADQLCLVQFTAGLARSDSTPLYGSASRHRDALDERDEAQWLCADVIEPAFKHVLPRQCAQLRAKCFVPEADASPVRRIRLERVSSAPQVPRRPRDKPLSAALEAERSSSTRTAPKAAVATRQIDMGRRLVRSTSTGSVGGPALSTAVRPAHKRKGHASRWGSQAHTLVAATPERPGRTQLDASPPSPSPAPTAMALDSSFVDEGSASEDEQLIIPTWRKSASRLSFLP